MAGATQERKLLGVGSTAWFGKEGHPPRDADPMVVFLDARSTTPRYSQTPV
jgi:hypothetical protein